MSQNQSELCDQLAAASTQAVDDGTCAHIETAISLVEELSGPELLECPVYGLLACQNGSSTTTIKVESTRCVSSSLKTMSTFVEELRTQLIQAVALLATGQLVSVVSRYCMYQLFQMINTKQV
jgi:hypothetical protein